MLDDRQRSLLGEFVRAHRERLRPRAGTGRRRTPGLRREELAVSAGISSTWCAWIEQGRPVQPSPETLSRLAAALELSAAERAYLFKLAGRIDPAGPGEDDGAAPEALRLIVEALPTPAYGLDRLWNARCWNAPAAHLFRGWLDSEADRNLLRFTFLEPIARELIPDWQTRALRLLGEFRADYGGHFRDAGVRALVESLSAASPLFAKAWEGQDVLPRAGGLRSFRHPTDGELNYQQFTYSPLEHPDFKLVMLTPASAPEFGLRIRPPSP
jgi:transcriptional regulator with XRE-family HTH domain